MVDKVHELSFTLSEKNMFLFGSNPPCRRWGVQRGGKEVAFKWLLVKVAFKWLMGKPAFKWLFWKWLLSDFSGSGF